MCDGAARRHVEEVANRGDGPFICVERLLTPVKTLILVHQVITETHIELSMLSMPKAHSGRHFAEGVKRQKRLCIVTATCSTMQVAPTCSCEEAL